MENCDAFQCHLELANVSAMTSKYFPLSLLVWNALLRILSFDMFSFTYCCAHRHCLLSRSSLAHLLLKPHTKYKKRRCERRLRILGVPLWISGIQICLFVTALAHNSGNLKNSGLVKVLLLWSKWFVPQECHN